MQAEKENLLMQDTVQEILCTDILKITSNITLEFAVSLALSRKIDDLYVVDDDQHLLGIVPGFTLIKSLIQSENHHTIVEQIMSRYVMTCESTLPIAEIAPLFREACNERIAVIQQGKLIGQLRRCDVMQWLARQAYQSETTEYQSHIGPPQFLKTRRVNQTQS